MRRQIKFADCDCPLLMFVIALNLGFLSMPTNYHDDYRKHIYDWPGIITNNSLTKGKTFGLKIFFSVISLIKLIHRSNYIVNKNNKEFVFGVKSD